MIFKSYKASDFGTNNYLLVDENSKEAALFDCTGDFEVIKKDIDKTGAKLKYILLTHAHFDHITGCNEFKAAYKNAKLCMHKQDEILLDNIEKQCAYFGLPCVKKPEIDMFIDENSTLTLGDKKIKVIHTPGHTLGGCCYLIDDLLISGDTLFYEEIGRCDLPGGSFQAIEKSIREKLFTLPDNTKVYPGHGDSSTIGHEKEHNAYFGKKAKY